MATYQGAAGNDYLEGGVEGDLILGLEGNDRLVGKAGDDTLIGSTGDDVLIGDDGNDTYVFNRGDGNDLIYAAWTASGLTADANLGRLDVLEFGAGITADDVFVKRVADDCIFYLVGTTDSVRVANFFVGEAAAGYQIDQVRFVDGTVWQLPQVMARILTSGTEGDDNLVGYDTSDLASGNGGNDYITGGLGNDTLIGGDGNDRLLGQTDDDQLSGGSGADYLDGGVGSDLLLGGDDADYIKGSSGNDTLEGGKGDDVLIGDDGDDTYRFNLGDGADVVYAAWTESGLTADANAGRFDVLQFGSGIDPNSVVCFRNGVDCIFSIIGTNDSVRVVRFWEGEGKGGYQIDQVQFADGTVWGLAEIKAHSLYGTEGDDTLAGFDETSDVALGNGGNDYITGGLGNDSLYGGDGNDRILGQGGDDYLVGDAGQDFLEGGIGNDTYVVNVNSLGELEDIVVEDSSTLGGVDTLSLVGVLDVAGTLEYSATSLIENVNVSALGGTPVNLKGNEFNNTLTGNADDNAIDAGAGDDVLVGGAGADTLIGGLGADTFVLAGDDLISDFNSAEGDSVSLGNLASSDVVRFDNVKGALDFSAATSTASLVAFASSDPTTLIGAAGNDSLVGSLGVDSLDGGAGNDTLTGGAGVDTLVGEGKGGYQIDQVQFAVRSSIA